MNADARNPHALPWFAASALLVYLGNYLIASQYPARAAGPFPEWAVAVDVFLLVPALYLLLVRPPLKKAVLAVFALLSFGVLAGAWIIPDGEKDAWRWLEQVRWGYLAALVIVQLTLLTTVLADIARARAAPNLETAVNAVILKRVKDAGIARLLQADARMWMYLFVHKQDRFQFTQPAFLGARHDANAANQLAFVVLVAAEIPIAHVLLHLYNPTLALVVSALSVYGLAFLYAEYRATLLRATTFEGDGLHIRSGVLGDVVVPYAAIASIENSNQRPRRAKHAMRFVGTASANLTLVLRDGAELQTLFGARRVERVHLAIDEPARFREALGSRTDG
ncbi:hypothetical protein [Aerolutibacter ruishenii]|uniref:Uncharacterized protein n=1 Tax=Aerolutibacter ruishenii TaxID=686800 RepID=A0A562LPI4_9GAMM|nr:hypothetical protein [Lysobacter ruishenii]TWI09515.1 hypothetical protein IP93_02132 [Lysobacter ruishenii]